MLFFFLSGAELDLSIIPAVGVIGILYVVFRVGGQVAGAWVGAKLSKAKPVVQKFLGFTLVPQAGVAIGLATTAMTVVPEFGAKIRTIILCGTVIYELTGPVITKIALKRLQSVPLLKLMLSCRAIGRISVLQVPVFTIPLFSRMAEW